MRTLKAALAVAILASVFAAPSSAQAQLGGDSQARAGIEKAKATGIAVDPTVEAAMARAPVGSCPNDPTQPRCPKATRVVESPTLELADGSIAFAPGPAATATRKARAAQWPWQCQLRLSDASPYKAAGYAQMNTSATCSTAVSAFELYGFLRKYYNGQWYNMASAGRRAAGGQAIHLHVAYNCTREDITRTWQAYAEGWALLNGGWHHASKARNHSLRCG